MNSNEGHDESRPYRMPAEWETHEGTWLAWPHNEDHWPRNFEPIPRLYATIVREIALRETVFICVNDAGMEASARHELNHAEISKEILDRISFFLIPTDASWSRDHGPIFVKDEEGNVVILDWVFNSWGRKYPPWDQDDIVPQRIGKTLNIPVIQPGIVLEGGSIDVNGKGTLLTTEQCLLNPNRNPQLSRAQIEEYLHRYLGASNVLWLKEGIIGDDTDGHVDDLARFVDESTVVCAIEKNPDDENYEILQRNYEDLKKMKDRNGRSLKIVTIPMPAPVFYEGHRLPASYANFYIVNQAVLFPTFRCKQDGEVSEILKALFPGRDIIGIDCVDLVWGLGTLHCSTQQQPVS